KLERSRAEVARLTQEADDLDVALASARVQKVMAEESAAAEADRVRKQQIGAAMTDYVQHCREVDDAMLALAARFTEAKKARARAESLMSDEERRGLGHFDPAISATLAATGFSLRDFLLLDGRFISRHNPANFIPLAQAATRAVSGWLEPQPTT